MKRHPSGGERRQKEMARYEDPKRSESAVPVRTPSLFTMFLNLRGCYGVLVLVTFVGSTEILDNFKPDPDDDIQVIRHTDAAGKITRTIIIPKIKPPAPTTSLPPKYFSYIPTWMTTQPTFDDEDDRFVLVSNSTYPIRSNWTQSLDTKGSIASSPQPPGHVPTTKRIRRRRRKKKLLKPSQSERNAEPASDSAYKNSKLLSLFTLIRFPNDDCSDGGTCYTQVECAHMGGTIGQPCARGYGVCCMLTTKCGASGEIDGRVFRSMMEQGVCSLTINKSSCTKQIRLDFLDLELEPPVDGECGPERLIITGQNRNSPVPIICGSNSGQHVYLDVDDVPGPVMVSVVTNNPRDFMIRVTQICDGSRLQAPKHCLQYYLDNEGIIESFNYRSEQGTPGEYFNNLDYSICIKKGAGMCSVVYTNEDNGNEMPFYINNVDPDGGPTVPEGEAGAEVFNCPDDFLAVHSVRLCGYKVNDASLVPDFTQNAPVTDSSNGPFIVSFVSDRSVSGLGFRLKYNQIPC